MEEIEVVLDGPNRELEWIGSSLDDLRAFPKRFRSAMGRALRIVQKGETHHRSKPMKGFGNYRVSEIALNSSDGAFRVIYTVRFQDAIYVLHSFQKKSKRGKQTPKSEIDLIRRRLKLAEEIHASKTLQDRK